MCSSSGGGGGGGGGNSNTLKATMCLCSTIKDWTVNTVGNIIFADLNQTLSI